MIFIFFNILTSVPEMFMGLFVINYIKTVEQQRGGGRSFTEREWAGLKLAI